MDNLTHTMIGVALGKAGLERSVGRGATVLLAVASNLPDLDIVVSLLRIPDSFLLRRTLTHSVFVMPIIALAATWILRKWFAELSFKKIFLLMAVGMGLHVFFDLVNSYGVVLLYPFNRGRFELAWLFIIDLLIWFFLLAPLAVQKISAFKNSLFKRERLWRVALAGLSIYVGLCGLSRWRSDVLLARYANAQGMTNFNPYVFPEALGGHRFRGVLTDGETLKMVQIHPWTGDLVFFKSYDTAVSDPRIKDLMATPRLAALMKFFKRPVFEWTEDGQVRVYDLRFISTVLPFRNSGFSFNFKVPSELVSQI
jgi:inner membrane protein